MPEASAARTGLTESALDHLLATGTSAVSLRSIASGIGVGHSLLIYHFGSLTGLLASVYSLCEGRQRVALAAIESTSLPPEQIIRQMWRRLAEVDMWPLYRLTFELRARADVSTTHDGAERDAWLGALESLVSACGIEASRGPDEALLWLAACRGLLWDLVCGAEPAAVDRAAESLFSRYDAGRGSR